MYTVLDHQAPATFFSSDITTLAGDQLQQLINIGGLTFYKNYYLNQTINGDYSVGSPAATYTASRGASNPATYVDSLGVIQVTTTSNQPRFTSAIYDSTGRLSRPGLIMERASTNIMIRTDGSAIGNVTGGTAWTGWAPEFNTTTTPVYSNVLVPELSSISGARSQRIQWSGTATNNNVKIVSSNTAVGSVAQNDVITISGWIRSQTGNVGAGVKADLEVWIRDSAGTALEINTGANFLDSGVDTTWKRFQQSVTATNASASRMSCKIGCQAGIDTGDVMDVEYYGIQVEINSGAATTWIPTITVGLTRNADQLSYVISGNMTAATETDFVRFTSFWNGATPITPNALLDTDTKRRFIILDNASSDTMAFYPNNTDNAGTVAFMVPDPVAFTNYVLAGAAQSTGNPNAEMYTDGVSTSTDNDDFTANVWGTNFYIGTTSGGSVFGGVITAVAFYNRVLTSTEVATVTTILNT